MKENTIVITARMKLKPEAVEPAKKELSKLVAATCAEAGCISYELLQTGKEGTSFMILENWNSKEDLDRHSQSAHFKAWMDASKDMMAEPAQLNIWKKVM
jgi:quinol monooxygenase YgiN